MSKTNKYLCFSLGLSRCISLLYSPAWTEVLFTWRNWEEWCLKEVLWFGFRLEQWIYRIMIGVDHVFAASCATSVKSSATEHDTAAYLDVTHFCDVAVLWRWRHRYLYRDQHNKLGVSSDCESALRLYIKFGFVFFFLLRNFVYWIHASRMQYVSMWDWCPAFSIVEAPRDDVWTSIQPCWWLIINWFVPVTRFFTGGFIKDRIFSNWFCSCLPQWNVSRLLPKNSDCIIFVCTFIIGWLEIVFIHWLIFILIFSKLIKIHVAARIMVWFFG